MINAQQFNRPELEIARREPLAQFIQKDEMTQLRVRQLVREVGTMAVSASVEAPEEVKPDEGSRFPSLMHALHAARSGDVEARRMVENNARTQVWEALMKNLVMRMTLEVDERGRLVQCGQLLRDVQKNALLHASALPQIRARTYAEIGNSFIMERLLREGQLAAGKKIVVWSESPDDMPEDEAGRLGFFQETMSCAIQMLYMQNGEIVQESGFVAARTARDAPRHDKRAIEYVLRSLDAPAEGLSATELLDSPLLVDESVTMATLLELYDEGAGGTFFGLKQLRRGYDEAIQEGRRKLDCLEPTVQQVVKAIIAESEHITNPVEAIKRLHAISKDIMVDLALRDSSIDARVFHEGAQHIEEGRRFLAMGNMEEFQRAWQAAHRTSRVSVCPVSLQERSSGEKSDDSVEEGTAPGPVREGPGKISWGYCRTSGCPRERRKGMVGECRVCLGCQKLWDHGIDPRTVYVPVKGRAQLDILMSSIKTLLVERERKADAAKGTENLAMAA